MGDYANDLGTFTVCSKLSHDEFVAALEAYFGHEPTLAEKRHVAATNSSCESFEQTVKVPRSFA